MEFKCFVGICLITIANGKIYESVKSTRENLNLRIFVHKLKWENAKESCKKYKWHLAVFSDSNKIKLITKKYIRKNNTGKFVFFRLSYC